MTIPTVSAPRSLVAFLVPATVAFALYAATLAPTVYWSDSAELQRAAVTLGKPHPTGYPLYLLAGRLWVTLVPLGDAAWRLNLMSAVAAAAAVGLTGLVTLRLTQRLAPAVLAGLLLAASASFWSQAVIAEVYALHALLTAALLVAALRPKPSLPLLALLLGLGLAHHRMTLLLVPGLAAYVWQRHRDITHDGRTLARAAALLVGGLALYLVTYWAIEWPNAREFWVYVLHSGNQFWSVADMPAYVAATVWPFTREQLGLLGLPAAALGLVWCWRRCPWSPATATLLGGSWLLALGFLAVYRVPDAFAFAGHLQVLSAVLIGVAAAAVLSGLESRLPGRLVAPASVALALAVGLIWLAGARSAWSAVHRSDDDWRYPVRRAHEILAAVQSNSVLVADPLLGQTLRYLQAVEGQRADLEIVIEPAKDADWAVGLLALGRPVYLWGTPWRQAFTDRPFWLVPAEHDPFHEGLARLVPGGALDGAPTQTLAAGADAGVDARLASMAVRPWPLVADELVEVTLCWSGNKDTLDGKEMSLVLDAQNGWLHHGLGPVEPPTDGACTTHRLILPPAPFSDAVPSRLIVEAGGDAAQTVVLVEGTWPVAPTGPAVSADRMRFGPASGLPAVRRAGPLVGVDIAPETRPGIAVPIAASWWVEAEAPRDLAARLALLGPDGQPVSTASVNVLEAFTPEPWRSAALVSTRHTLDVPRRAPPGRYTVAIADTAGEPWQAIGSVHVRDWDRLRDPPAVAHASDFHLADDSLRLRGYDVETDGAGVDVTLVWQGDRRTDADWKVFVHLLGPDGLPALQHDAYPGDGLRWTNGWEPGEVVVDSYRLEPAEPLPDGRYRLVAGMYDPSTGQRATVRAPDGTEPQDRAMPLAVVLAGSGRLSTGEEDR